MFENEQEKREKKQEHFELLVFDLSIIFYFPYTT